MWPFAFTHYMYKDSFKFEFSLNTKEKYETMCEFIQRGSKGTLFWTALGVFSHHLDFLVFVKTLLWNQLFFSLTVSTLMFIIIISSLFMGAVNLYLGAVHPNSGHWIIGQVSIRPLTGHKNWFGSESSGKVSGKNVLDLLLGQNISTRTMKNWKGLDSLLTFVMKFTAMAVFRVRHSLQTHCTLIMHLAAAW